MPWKKMRVVTSPPVSNSTGSPSGASVSRLVNRRAFEGGGGCTSGGGFGGLCRDPLIDFFLGLARGRAASTDSRFFL